MDKKSKIVLVLLVITLLSLSSYASLSRFSKGINKEGSINTTEMEYCKLNEIDSFSECLIRNDSKQELSLALNTIEDRTSRLDLKKIEPYDIYIPKTEYVSISNKTNTEGIVSITETNFTYVIESKLINPFSVNDNEIENITFNEDTGYYTYTNSLVGSINDIITTSSDIDNNIYKYTCLNSENNGNCEELYLFTEEAYLISNEYIFKEGYKYSNEFTDTTSRNAGLYKGEDDYTINDSNYTYYYRGDVKNNWVKFGNYLWRIVRINGDGTIRMIYSGLVDAPNHTGNNAYVKNTAYSKAVSYTTTTTDLFDSNNTITTSYINGRHGPTYVGYMYNPVKEIATYPDRVPGNTSSTRLNNFTTFSSMNSTTNYYFFKNFNPEEDCFTGDGTEDDGACTLKCRKLGDDGDCVKSVWNDLATKEGNYSTTAPGVYPVANPTQYIYTGEYKYTCWAYSTPVTKNNSDGTTSVYISCPVVTEIIGTVKDKPTQAKVRYHGVFSPDAITSNSNVKDSKIKQEVDSWYENNIMNKSDGNSHILEDYLSDSIFCNDRSSSSEGFPLASGAYSYYFEPSRRTNNPSFKCPNISNDGFTLKTSGTESRVVASGIGNNMLTYPVGLITFDEALYAGGSTNLENSKFYLNIGVNYWTMSPCHFEAPNIIVQVWRVHSSNVLNSNTTANNTNGLRPVINLKSDILYKGGNGTESNPYIIDVNN